MSWEAYRESYRGFLGAQAYVRLLYYLSHMMVNDLPQSLPADIREQIARNILEIGSIFHALFDALEQKKDFDQVIPISGRDEYERLFVESFFQLGLNLWERLMSDNISWEDTGTSPFTLLQSAITVDIGRLVNSQALVMLFAHLDAFVSESVRTACRARPEILRNQGKQVSWETVLRHNDIRELQQYLMETLVLEVGFQSYQKRIENIRRLLGLEVDFDAAILAELDAAECVRNVVMHNGGKVSPEFLKRSQRTDVNVGESISVALADIEAVVSGSAHVATTLYEAVCTKFCGVSKEQLRADYHYSGRSTVVGVDTDPTFRLILKHDDG